MLPTTRYDESARKGLALLDDVAETLGVERRDAYRVLRWALSKIREGLSARESAQLRAALPLAVRMIYDDRSPALGSDDVPGPDHRAAARAVAAALARQQA